MTDPGHLIYRSGHGVGHFTINREDQRNALSLETISLFLDHLETAEKSTDVRVICLTGAGDRVFCAGADLGDAATGSIEAGFKTYAQLLKRLCRYPKPVVARVNGHCMAGGMGLMLACDIVVTTDRARFGTPEVNVGLFPMMIGALIYRNVLRKKAMEMVLLGERFTAAEAQEIGLVSKVVAPDQLDTEVDATLQKLAGKSPIGMKIGKEAFFDMADMPLEEAVDFLAGKIAEVAATEDAREGIMAFLEKRPPVFKGK
jgi:enoyl-CoA hydratase/carnithine racemase